MVLGGLGFDWNQPTREGIMYNSAEGGWQAPRSDTLDIFYAARITENDDVIAALADMIECETRVQREFYRGTDSQRLTWGWDSFKAFTKNNTRYFFLQNGEEGYGEVTPSEMFASISDMILSKLADAGLIKTINADADLVRIRVADEPHIASAQIGTPKAEFARQSNRKSPAGIPMFYGAFDRATAYAETFDAEAHAGKILSIGTFKPCRPLTVSDLADLPAVPSVFDLERHGDIHPLRFLHAFGVDISQPIAREGREHIDYVSIQIVTEYFRRIFRLKGNAKLDGIVYRSAKAPAEKAFVLFCENQQCVEADEVFDWNAVVRLVAVVHQ